MEPLNAASQILLRPTLVAMVCSLVVAVIVTVVVVVVTRNTFCETRYLSNCHAITVAF